MVESHISSHRNPWLIGSLDVRGLKDLTKEDARWNLDRELDDLRLFCDDQLDQFYKSDAVR